MDEKRTDDKAEIKEAAGALDALVPAETEAEESAAVATEAAETGAVHEAVPEKAAGPEKAGVSEAATVPAGGAAPQPASTPLPPEEIERMTADIVEALKTVYDPEIPADIYELGLIYKVEVDDDRNVAIDMTLTAPGCPVAGEMPLWVENAVDAVPGVASTKVTLVFDPPWDQSRMSDEAKLAVGMF